jgi:membrane-bound inhibitor of C-type lysozyme
MKKIIFIVLLAILAVGGYVFYCDSQQAVGGQKDGHECLGSAGYSWCEARQNCERPWERYCTAAPPNIVHFSCDDNKKISAMFYPTDDMYVDLVLSDGRAISLPHMRSGSGARYANTNESIVFWNKGSTAFVTEGVPVTYANCKRD